MHIFVKNMLINNVCLIALIWSWKDTVTF